VLARLGIPGRGAAAAAGYAGVSDDRVPAVSVITASAAALGVPGAVVPAQVIHRVAAGHTATLPGDCPAARTCGGAGRRLRQATSPPQTSRLRSTIQPHHASAHEQIIAVLYGQGPQSWPPDAELICQQLLGVASGQRWIRYARKAGVGLLSGTWWQNSSTCLHLAGTRSRIQAILGEPGG